jgi:hypothetical protein
MSIRTRLLVLLLCLSLLPMALLGVYTLRSLDALGERVGTQAREALLAGELARLRDNGRGGACHSRDRERSARPAA